MRIVGRRIPRALGPMALCGLALSSPMLVVSAREAGQGTQPAPRRQRPIEDLRAACGGSLTIATSRQTGLPIFLSAPRSGEIPVGGENAQERARSFVAAHGTAFGLRGVGDLRLIGEGLDDLGFEHLRYQQLYKGVPVTGAELILHLHGAGLRAIAAKTVADIPDLTTTPSVSAIAAADAARAHVERLRRFGDLACGEPRLEVLARHLLGRTGARARLAWRVEVRASGIRELVWIDAQRARVLMSLDVLAQARTRAVYDRHACAEQATLVRSEGSAASGDPDADRAYEHAGHAHDYFSREHGRDGYDATGARLISLVHDCAEAAAWDGAAVRYGEGFPQADDIVGHEWTHAVLESSTGALPVSGQAASVRESFSDLFGEIIDLTNGAGSDDASQRWLIGEDLPASGAVRSMAEPSRFGDPGRIGDASYDCSQDLASHAGVLNHAFALMADGGTYNGRTIRGLGLAKTGRVAYRALTRYLLASADLADASHALRQSCDDLAGAADLGAADCDDVRTALDAVELEQPACQAAPETSLCAPGRRPVNAFFDDFEGPRSETWTTEDLAGSTNAWLAGADEPSLYSEDWPHSGRYHLRAADLAPASDSAVVMAQEVTVPAEASLHFWHASDIPLRDDGGVLEYSLGGGAWQDASPLHIAGASPSTTALPPDASNPLAGRRVFADAMSRYGESLYDLSSLAGRQARFRFRFGTDDARPSGGWYVDDVRIYACAALGKIAMGAPATSVRPTSAAALVTVVRSGDLSEALTAGYRTKDGTALADRDYVPVSGSLVFAEGAATRTISVPILRDMKPREGRTFEVELTGVSGSATLLGDPARTTITFAGDAAAGPQVQFSAAQYAGREAGPAALVTVARTGDLSGPATVAYATSDGSAAGPGDYSPTSGALTFDAGQASRSFTIQIADDCLAESGETVNLTLSAPEGATLGARATAVLQITDDDPAGALQFGASRISLSEGGGSATVLVTRPGGRSCGVLVDYATADGTAQAGSDYASTSGTLSFDGGQTSRTFTVPVTQDLEGENDETIHLTLTNPRGGAALGAGRTAVLTILEDERVVQLQTSATSVSEAAGSARIVVKRAGLLAGQATVGYEAFGGSATPGKDFGGTTGALTFMSGGTTATITVPLVNDTLDEAAETVVLRLRGPESCVLGPRDTTTVTILDNDTAGVFRFGATGYPVGEGNRPITISVVRSGGVAGPATVGYATSGGSATAGSDYAAVSGTLTFAAGQMSRTATVQILGDADAEGSETVGLVLSDPTGGATLGAPAASTIVIADDEPVVELSAAGYAVAEGGLAAVSVRRSGGLKEVVTVEYATSDGTAVAPGDYAPRGGVLTFAPGAALRTFQVPTAGDTSAEGDETVGLTLRNASGAALGRQATAVLSIKDNDAGGSIELGSARYVVAESSASVAVAVRRSGGLAGGVSVEYQVSDGTATAGSDYMAPAPNPGMFTFGPGQALATLALPILDDTLGEDGETALLVLRNPTGGATLGALSSAVLTITDNDAQAVQFAAAAAGVSEAQAGALVAVKRVGGATGTITVDYATLGGSATPGEDFAASSGTLTFDPGVLARTIVVPIVNDGLDEAPETLLVNLSSSSPGARLGFPRELQLTILDNDLPAQVQFESASYSAVEDEGQVLVTLKRSGPTTERATVDYTAADGTALAPGDYAAAAGTVTFAPGETTKALAIALREDTAGEASESVNLTIAHPSAGTLLGPQASALLWIVDDECVAAPGGLACVCAAGSVGNGPGCYAARAALRGLCVVVDFLDSKLEDYLGPGFNTLEDVRAQLSKMSSHWRWMSVGIQDAPWDIVRIGLPYRLTSDAYPDWYSFREDVVTRTREALGARVSDYDSDGDGLLDTVWIVPSAKRHDLPYLIGGAARAGQAATFVDGQATLSVIVGATGNFNHEAGHNRGLPDLYGDFDTVSFLTLMSDSWPVPPLGFSAYERQKLGWLAPRTVSEDTTGIVLRSSSSYMEAVKIPGVEPYEYFLVEYRKRPASGFGSTTPLHDGLAIYHVYEGSLGDGPLPLLKLEPADGVQRPGRGAEPNDLWYPGHAGPDDAFEGRTYYGGEPFVQITSLVRTDDGIQFDVHRSPPTMNGATTLVRNGGFETSGSAWSSDSWDPGATTFRWETGTGRSGSNCASIEALTAGVDGEWSQVVSGLEVGQAYEMRGWVKGQNIRPAGIEASVGASLSLSDTYAHSSASGLGTFDWQEFAVGFVAEAASVRIACRLGYWGNLVLGKAWFDDVRLIRLTTH